MTSRGRAAATITATACLTGILAVLPAVSAAADAIFEAESATLTNGAGTTYSDSTASGGRALLVWSNGTASATWTTPTSTHLVVRARGDQCKGSPHMEVRVNGVILSTTSVSATTWTDYAIPAQLPSGSHRISVTFSNDYRTRSCDRNLRVDRITAVAAATPAPSPSPSAPAPSPSPSAPSPPPQDSGNTNALSGATLYVDPASAAARTAADLRDTDPTRAAQLDKIAGQSQADWIGDWVGTSEVAASVDRRVDTITAAGALPVLVVYAIPGRDCGGYSAGGVGTPEGYQAWVREFAKGLGGRRAAVVLEPDSLALINCLSAEMQQTRLSLLADAVAVLTTGGAQVYLDAGHSAWVPADTMAGRLSAAGVAGARGFALNVSNFRLTSDEVGYGRDLSQRLGGKSFVIDTSRNGLGPASGTDAWCNPSGRGLGVRPNVATSHAEVDAYLWVKRPGESDGTCNGGPVAGVWWTDYAVGLAERAGW
jgi:endoglucanase